MQNVKLKDVFSAIYEPSEDDFRRGYVPFHGIVQTEYSSKNMNMSLGLDKFQFIAPPISLEFVFAFFLGIFSNSGSQFLNE